jgi:hypothetical protein
LSASAIAHGTDQEQIQHAMMATFDKPANPLKVAPVTVQGDYAVAGWIQVDKGGRCCKRPMINGKLLFARAMV